MDATHSHGTAPAPKRLGERSIGAVLWSALGAVTRLVLQLVSQIALARILGPETFGLFAIALVTIMFTVLFSDLGLAYGLIQRKTVSNVDIRFVFTWQIVLGVVTTLVLSAVAPLIASVYGDERLTWLIRVISLICVINAFGATAGMLLRRALDFRSVNLAAVVSYAIGFIGIGLPMAVAGFGVTALVTAYMIQMTVASGMMFWCARHDVYPLFRNADAAQMLGFGGTVLATNVVNWVMTSIDRLVVGATMQVSAAGVFATVANLITTPSTAVHAVLQSVLYAASARVQDSGRQLRIALRTMFGAVAIFLAPVFFAIGAVAETFMLAVYGAQWADGAAVLRPLAWAMPAFLLMGMAIPILWSAGQVRQEFRLQVPIAIVWVIVLVGVARLGSLALLSWAVCALYHVRAAVIVAATLRAVGMTASELPRLLGAGTMVTVLVALCAVIADIELTRLGAGVHLRLALVALACGVAMLAGLRLARRMIGLDVLRLLAKIADRVPGGHGRVMLRRLLLA